MTTVSQWNVSQWKTTELRPGLQAHATRPMPDIPLATEAKVASAWAEALLASPRLFNGTVFSADTITAGRIEGHWTEYRRVLAQMRNPDLFEALRIRALAVNGLLECADGLVLGRREPGSIYQPGTWQSPPAGSVERRTESSLQGTEVDLSEQVLAECEEELGISARDVVVRCPVAAIEHPESHIVDVGILLQTHLSFAEIEVAWAASGNREYDRLSLLTYPEACQDSLSGKLLLLSTTRILLEAWLKNRSLP